MGTRHIIIVIKDKKPKLAQYGQWDGYPSGQGIKILRFLRSISFDKFTKQIDSLQSVTIDTLDEITSMEDWEVKYPEFSRDTGAEILDLIYKEKVKLVDLDLNFPADSIFCEYAYVIDLDKNTFEIYFGFNETPLTKKDRFFYLQNGDRNQDISRTTYYPVKIKKKYTLDKLPTDEKFLSDLKDDEEE